jgi:hypothetical protein
MRLSIVVLMLAAVLPAAEAAKPPKGQCISRCGNLYQACMKNARAKSARKSCKATRKGCKGGCG